MTTLSLKNAIKITVIAFSLFSVFWINPLESTRAIETGQDPQTPSKAVTNDQFAGSEACRDCHGEMFEKISKTPHVKVLSVVSRLSGNAGCESCHGPGKEHVDGGGDITRIIRFKDEPAKELSQTCLQCHTGREEHNNFLRGEHGRNDVGCMDCHSVHSADLSRPKMLAKPEPQLCFGCHVERKGDFQMPFHHRVIEGAIKCSDCHNSHGGFERKQLRAFNSSDAACIKCHIDKQGPFVYEHAPLKVEGCTMCHIPHGANNPKLLKRDQVSQLCIECHSGVGTVGGLNTPSFHNLATAKYQNCTVCHVRIHGSNASSAFFR